MLERLHLLSGLGTPLENLVELLGERSAQVPLLKLLPHLEPAQRLEDGQMIVDGVQGESPSVSLCLCCIDYRSEGQRRPLKCLRAAGSW